MYKYALVALIACQSVFGAEKGASRIGMPKYLDMARMSHMYLAKNRGRLVAEKNESGFLRITIPVPKEQRDKFGDIRKFRLNFWVPASGVQIQQESIHSHPNYFESLVLNGGYMHELFGRSKDPRDEHDLYTIYKDGPNKSFNYIGRSLVKKTGEQRFKQGSLITFDKTMIHRVVETTPSTLTLNAVFGSEDAPSSYDVYLSKNGTLDDIKTDRQVLLPSDANPFIEEASSHLDAFLKKS